MGAGTQVLTHVPYFALVGTPDEGLRAVLMGAGWVINLIVAESIIRRGNGYRQSARNGARMRPGEVRPTRSPARRFT